MVVNTSIISTPVSGVASLRSGGIGGRDTSPPSPLLTSLSPLPSPLPSPLLVEEEEEEEEEEEGCGRELR